MIRTVEEKREQIAEICRRFGVRRLDLFGSVTESRFDPQASDIDFLVDFPPEQSLGPWARLLTALKEELAELLGHPVDVVMTSALRDPFFRKEAEKSRVTLYNASEIQKVAE